MLLLALSCLQGRTIGSALRELGPLADGVQLTPGNVPSTDARGAATGLLLRTHHGFAFDRRSARVWGDDGRCLVDSDSIHPPRSEERAAASWRERLEERHPAIETMYPGYELGTGDSLEEAMRARLPLAVDVSHVFIQQTAGVIAPTTWRRLMEYDAVREIHLSANDGRRDLHLGLAPTSFGLGWAREKLRAGTPVVIECYMHVMPPSDRQRQVALARDE